MAHVAEYIESFGFKKFMRLNSREQNQMLYDRFPKADKSNLRMQKKKYIDKKLSVNTTTKTKTLPKKKEEIKEVKRPIKEQTSEDSDFEINQQFKEMIAYHSYALEQGVDKISMADVLKYFQASKQLENQEKEFAEDNQFLQEVESQLLEFTFGEPMIDKEVLALELKKSKEAREIEE